MLIIFLQFKQIKHLRTKKSNSNIDWSHFLKFMNSVAKLITSSHKIYPSNIIGSNHVDNPKCLWSYVKLRITDNNNNNGFLFFFFVFCKCYFSGELIALS